ncbi:hypothetical protein [Actinomadura sp. WAC 06369]|uniref:hypothetical protein n=1 Tax=Actinomadura sp. WAC 06369 TaxID=2203193 RepID=UPI000F77754D|nr:hypothetical protein [Actinomadura sp. WAC 06369]RSN71184.1 hypothetical protein DMH08_03395 [Actinomadura sp. WAC 06369]
MTTPPDAGEADPAPAGSWTPPDALPPASTEATEAAGAAAAATPTPAENRAARETDRTAVVALITGLIGLVPLAVPFAVAALVRLRRGTRKGRALAAGALAASLAWTAAAALAAVLASSDPALDRDAAGAVTTNAEVPFAELRDGDCFRGYDFPTPIESLGTVTAVPCTAPHTGEIIARVPLPDDAAPSTPNIVCTDKYMYLQKSRAQKQLAPLFGVLETGRGKAGERWIVCAQHYKGTGLRTPLAATVDNSLKAYYQLTPGTCIKSRTVERPIVTSAVPCSEPHWNEVFATYEISVGGTYAPGTLPELPSELVYRDALARCAAEARKLFRKVPPKPGLEIEALPPLPADRERGILTVLCTVRADGEGMRGSIMPG